MKQTRLPLFLFSGLGADERMFRKQRHAFPELVVPKWVKPIEGETLRQYARRMAAQLDPNQPCVIGGASFGGFLALEMLPYLNAKACVLIGAVRSPEDMPRRIRFFNPAHRLCRILPYEVFALMCGAVRGLLGLVLPRTVRIFLELGTSLDPDFFRWATEAVLTWGDDGPMPPPRVPVHQIHGSRDRVIPVDVTRPDVIVQGSGHLVALSHPDELNAWLRGVLDQHAAG